MIYVISNHPQENRIYCYTDVGMEIFTNDYSFEGKGGTMWCNSAREMIAKVRSVVPNLKLIKNHILLGDNNLAVLYDRTPIKFG